MKTFIGYVSMSGNTEDIANVIKNVLLSSGCEVEMECLDTVEVETLVDYDCIFIGAYTWGDGDLPYEAEDFFEDLNGLHLAGVNAACFGSGDSAYPKFCMAVDTLAKKLEERGAKVFGPRLKIEFSPETEQQIEECNQFTQSVIEWVMVNKGVGYV
ncbi:flavodoxin [Peribacillus alkalitolerans]|uniref:flavodoxin n=1 Tax=Peribacillus alkalitolerans TaxID=1550385 RepID=UPI0013D33E12|nr:flavodoxin [Peribacillus alkalitolerans]